MFLTSRLGKLGELFAQTRSCANCIIAYLQKIRITTSVYISFGITPFVSSLRKFQEQVACTAIKKLTSLFFILPIVCDMQRKKLRVVHYELHTCNLRCCSLSTAKKQLILLLQKIEFLPFSVLYKKMHHICSY